MKIIRSVDQWHEARAGDLVKFANRDQWAIALSRPDGDGYFPVAPLADVLAFLGFVVAILCLLAAVS